MSTSFAAATPLVATTSINGVATQSSAPTGPLPSAGSVTAWQSAVSSAIGWNVDGAGGTKTARLGHYLDGFDPSASLTATSELVVTFVATSAAPAYLRFDGAWSGTAGVPVPFISIDVGNDGTWEIAHYLALLTTWIVQIPPLGPNGLAVRVRMSSKLDGPAVLNTQIDVSVVPVNDVTIHQTALACSVGAGWMPSPQPSFADLGVDIAAWPMGGSLLLFVIGFDQQPVLLPPYAGLTCVLIPTPDIVLWLPTNLLHVPLPAAVRPAAFDVQGVVLSPTGIAVTEGYRIVAN